MFKGIGGTLLVAALLFGGSSFAQEEPELSEEEIVAAITQHAREEGVPEECIQEMIKSALAEEPELDEIEGVYDEEMHIEAGFICGLLCDPLSEISAMDLDGDGFISQDEMTSEDVMEHAMRSCQGIEFDDDDFDDDDYSEIEDDD